MRQMDFRLNLSDVWTWRINNNLGKLSCNSYEILAGLGNTALLGLISL